MRPPCSSVVAETPDFTIEALHGLGFGYGAVSCFPACHRMTRKKKTGHESEQVLPDVIKRWRVSDLLPMLSDRFRENPGSCASGPACRP